MTAMQGTNAIRDHWRKVDPEKKGSSSDISQLWPFRSLMREGDLVIVSWGNSHFRAIGQITGPYRYDPSGIGEYLSSPRRALATAAG